MLAHHTSQLLVAFGRELRALGGRDEAADVAAEAMDRALRRGEDVLTALVFERLRYLPVDVTWRLLVDAATPLRGERPARPDTLSFTFWPLLQHPTEDRQVEPDVVVEGDDVVLVIEVKWHDVQRPEQLDREAAAVGAVHPSKSLALLALGGATGRRREGLQAECSATTLLALDWPELHAALKAELRRDARQAHERAVLEDIMAVLALRNPLWARAPLALASLPATSIAIPGQLAVRFLPPSPPRSPSTRSFASLPSSHLDATCLFSWRLR